MHKDGTRISVEFTIVPFHDDEGRMVGVAAVMRDVTERFEENEGSSEVCASAAAENRRDAPRSAAAPLAQAGATT